MNKKLVLFLAAVFAAALAAPVFAQVGPTSGNLLLKGTVPQILQITVTSLPGAETLDLSVAETGKIIANVTEKSNKKAGYSVSLSSANNGVLKSGDVANTDTVPYQISYGTFNAQPSTTPAGAVAVAGKTTGLGTVRDVLISYAAPPSLLYEDDYTDTLTFTISAP